MNNASTLDLVDVFDYATESVRRLGIADEQEFDEYLLSVESALLEAMYQNVAGFDFIEIDGTDYVSADEAYAIDVYVQNDYDAYLEHCKAVGQG